MFTMGVYRRRHCTKKAWGGGFQLDSENAPDVYHDACATKILFNRKYMRIRILLFLLLFVKIPQNIFLFLLETEN